MPGIMFSKPTQIAATKRQLKTRKVLEHIFPSTTILTHIKHFMSKFFCIEKSPHLYRVKRPPLLLHPHDDIRICNYIFAHYNDMNYTKPNSCAVILCSQVQTRFSGVISVAPRVCPTLPSETAHGLKSLAAHSVIEKKSSIFYIRNMFHTLYCTTTT